MNENFNNETMVNNGVEAMDTRKLVHDAVNVYQVASAIIVAGMLGYKLVKYIGKKRKEAKTAKVNIEVVRTEDIEATEEN
nr:MAG TPA: hypothetical protein [Caudoviricetes sp.]